MENDFNNFTETELAQEQWRDIFGYEGAYQVSDLGRVRSLKFGRVKVLRARKTNWGYVKVQLSKDGKQKTANVHRLVASAFIPNDNIFNNEINHKDENKENNRASNLEWCNSRYNKRYNDLHNRRITKRTKVKDLYNPDLTYDQNLEIFRANGIPCSRDIIKRLRRDLNLEPHPNYKRHKLKDLYRPDLSINENIEVFRANGIECSNNTIVRLRKDLGLSRPRKKPN